MSAILKPKRGSAKILQPQPVTRQSKQFGSGRNALRRNIKTSEAVAQEIVHDIGARTLQQGDRMPSEAELVEHYDVSRSSLREALRLLEVQGLVTIRPGPKGGNLVGKAHPAQLARTLTLHLQFGGVTYDELLDTWILTESILAQRAAKNPDGALIKRVMEPYLHRHVPDGTHSIDEGLKFHEDVADLAGNRVLAFSLSMAGIIVTEHLMATIDRKSLEDDIVDDHDLVAKAIITRNPDKAYKAMHDHILRVAQYFRDYWPQKVGERIRWR